MGGAGARRGREFHLDARAAFSVAALEGSRGLGGVRSIGEGAGNRSDDRRGEWLAGFAAKSRGSGRRGAEIGGERIQLLDVLLYVLVHRAARGLRGQRRRKDGDRDKKEWFRHG